MSLFRHTLIALTYIAIAAAVGTSLPAHVPDVSREFGLVIGGFVLVLGALLHEVSARREVQGKLTDELRELRVAQGGVMRELMMAREEVGRLYQAIESAQSSRPSRQSYDEIVAEVKVLQDQVNQLSKGKAHAGQGAGLYPAVVSEAPPAASLDDATILDIVRDGIKADRIELYLQPIVSLPQRKRRFYEAFTRIRAEDGSVVVPDQYIAIAEREGLVAAVDNILLFRCVQLVRQTQRKNQNIGFFCNISAHTLADQRFFHEFIDFMGKNAELAADLIFELPQSTLTSHDPGIEENLARLAGLGFRFSMDQVASLNLDYAGLADRRCKFVKIQADAMLAEFHNPTTPIAIVDLKRVLERHGIDLIVEKIEDEGALRELLDFQIDYGQGYLFGPPRQSRS